MSCPEPRAQGAQTMNCNFAAVLFSKIAEYLPRFHALSKSKKLEIILSGFNLQNIEPDQRNIPVVFAVQNYILKTKVLQLPPNHPPLLPIMPPHHNHNLSLILIIFSAAALLDVFCRDLLSAFCCTWRGPFSLRHSKVIILYNIVFD